MRKLLNTLYVTTPQAYLSLDGENIVVLKESETLGRLPLHTIEGIIAFGSIGASPALMGKCSQMNKSLVFLKQSGSFLAKVTGKNYGNILLRREQYRVCDDPIRSLEISRSIIGAKIASCATIVKRAERDHGMRLDTQKLLQVYEALQRAKTFAYRAENSQTLRGIEGEAANRYFSVFDDMLLQQKDEFFYTGRSRRPPTDRVNALLSFSYSLLTSMCVSALETVGLDPYAGMFHVERPGRCSLALDLEEEFRAAFADRFVLTAVNRRTINASDFCEKENEGVLLTDEGRKTFLSQWQTRKREEFTHPYLQ